MKKAVKLNILYPSVLITIFLAYITPCWKINDGEKAFGFPFGWFTIYNDKIDDIIFASTGVNIIPLLANILIMYFLIFFCSSLYKKKKMN